MARSCGTMEEHRELLNGVPEYAAARTAVETLAWAHRRGFRRAARRGMTRIPTVVHVVWNTAAQNISDAQIQSQVTVLNQDFRRTNPDVAQVPPVWANVVGDARVEFFLATADPNGQMTNGITRTQTQVASFVRQGDPVKSVATGGADPWPADRYLNIWVCRLAGTLLGYATFPGAPAAIDGVVITHTAFGTTGTATAPFNGGRTATHEVGHWLNLFHIWGDDGTGCNGTDEVDDTPNQAGFNVACPTFPSVSCNNGPNGDMFMNYMDYTDDACMFMFTVGQVARMQATLDGPRAGLAPSPPLGQFLLQTGTALHETDATFEFAMADWDRDGIPDLVAIKKSNTGSNSTEVHILSGASGFQQFIVQTGTALHETDAMFEFAMADWDRDGIPDLVAIKKSNTGSNSTEVHILSGASGFQQFIVQTGTALHETDAMFEFAMADWDRDGIPELVAIKKSNTGSNSTEVHILSGASGFQQFIVQTGTALHETDATFEFAMADWDRDGIPELVAIKKSGAGTQSSEVHIL